MKKIKPIHTEAEHEAALDEIDRLERLDPKEEGSPNDDVLEVLYTLVEDYEEQVHPIDPPDPIEAIKFRMDQMGWERKDLEPFLGSRARVSEVLSGARPLSITMIRRLAETGIPADVLIREPGESSRDEGANTVRESKSRYRTARRRRNPAAKRGSRRKR